MLTGESESERRGKKVMSCLLALSFLPCVLHFPCRSPSPPSLSPFLFTIPPISSVGSLERSICRPVARAQSSPISSSHRLDCRQPEPEPGRIDIQLHLPKSVRSIHGATAAGQPVGDGHRHLQLQALLHALAYGTDIISRVAIYTYIICFLSIS